MEKARILIIAPYKGLYEMAAEIKQERDDVLIDVAYGNLEAGVQIAAKMQHDGYDAIISRGGTSQQIEAAVELPVIDIEFSAYDMMRILSMTDCMYEKEAIVGFPSIAKCARIVSELMDRDICVKTINSQEEVVTAIMQLQKEGYSIIIGDQIVHDIATRQNINSILFLSGPESLHKSIDEAIKITEHTRENRIRIDILKGILSGVKEKIMVRDEQDQVFYENCQELGGSQERYEELFKTAGDAAEGTIWLEDQAYVWEVRKMPVCSGERRVTVCYASQYCADVEMEDGAVRVVNTEAMPEVFYYKYYGTDPRMKQICDEITIYGKTLLPILLIGEKGVGKRNIAYSMHKESGRRRQPFIIIECERLSSEHFQKICSNPATLLYNREGGTIYFDNIDCLPYETQQYVVKYITSAAVAKSFRFLFAATGSIEEGINEGRISRKLGKLLTEFILYIPPLRERTSCIEGIAGMMIHELNMRYGRHVIGFDSKGREQLRSYAWPGNISQLQRVIRALVLGCRKARITTEDLSRKLEEERCVGRRDRTDTAIDLSRPLDDIIDDVIGIVMEEEDMNQSNVAKRLGISRSTLWRRLNNSQ